PPTSGRPISVLVHRHGGGRRWGATFPLVRLETARLWSADAAAGRPRRGAGHGQQRGPMNIVVSNVKGGVGKTTTAVYLAAAAVERGWEPVTLVDADRQASSAERIVRATLDRAHAAVVPTRAGGVEYSRVAATLDLVGRRTPYGVVITSARL